MEAQFDYKLNPMQQNFVFTRGGLGDYICMSQALVWIVKTQPHLTGHVWAVGWFLPLLREILKDAPAGWTIRDRERYDEEANDQIMNHYSANGGHATGFNMLDYGFHVFTNQNPIPEGWNHYPEISPVNITHLGLPERYVVLTPCSTTLVRTQTPESFNGLKNYLIKEGYKPVLLGQTIFGERLTPVHDEYDFEGCLSLLNSTSILEAQAVLAGAQAVCGLDNGLLHLAATSTVPILFGHTTASPKHREPRRRQGKHIHLVPSVPCEFCQSRARFTYHIFDTCVLKHYDCLKALSSDRWIRGFQELIQLKENQHAESR